MPTTYMTFTSKDVETLKSEVLTNMGIEYEGNEDAVDTEVASRLKDEEFKASVHDQKEKHKTSSELYKQRLEKAGIDPETGEKIASKEVESKTPENAGMSARDIIAFRDVHEDDVDYLLEEAKLRKISVAEVKKNPYTQIILKTRAEERATAEATATKGTFKKAGQSTEEKVLGDFSKGIAPVTEEDSAALAKAQFDKLLKGTK